MGKSELKIYCDWFLKVKSISGLGGDISFDRRNVVIFRCLVESGFRMVSQLSVFEGVVGGRGRRV